MKLKVFLPSRVFLEIDGVSSVIAQGRDGSFGLLPRRRDCVVSLAPGILTYQTDPENEVNLAIDEGLLVKTGPDVVVSTRNAVDGVELGELKKAVESEFAVRDEQERSMRTAIAKLEDSMLRRIVELKEGR